MAEANPSSNDIIGQIFRWLTDPNAPPPVTSSQYGGNTFGGNTFGGNTFGGAQYGQSAGQPLAGPPDQPGISVPTGVGDYLTNPGAPAPGSVAVRPSISIPLPTAGTTGRMPAVTPQPPISSMAGADQWLNANVPGLPSGSPAPVPMGAGPGAAQMPSPQPSFLVGRGPQMPNKPTPSDTTDAMLAATVDHVTDTGRLRGMPQIYPKGQYSGVPQVAMGAPNRALVSPPLPSPSPATPAAPSPSGPVQGSPPGSPAAPPSPPTVPEDRADNVAVGGGPGIAVPHDQAAALAAGAGNLGTQVAGNDGLMGQIINDLRTKGLANDPENAWMALAKAGFATMASRSPFALQAIGEGASAGLDAFNQMRAGRAQQLNTAASLAQRDQQIQQQGQYQKGQLGIDQRRLDQADQEFQEKVRQYNQDFPLEQAKTMALVNLYNNHADLFGTKASQPGGGSGVGGNGVIMQQVRAVMADADARGEPMSFSDALVFVKTAGGGQNPNLRARILGQVTNTINNTPALAGLSADEKMSMANRLVDEQMAGFGGTGSTSAPATTTPSPSTSGGMPKGALAEAKGYTDGQTANQGKLVARGGYWYPVQ